MEDKRLLATLDFLKEKEIKDIKENTIHFYNNEHINISDYQREVSKEFSTANTMEKIELKKKYEMLPYDFILLKLNSYKNNISKKKETKDSKVFRKEKKSFTIPAFRVDEKTHNLYLKRISKLSEKNPKFNKTKYLTNLVISDVTNVTKKNNDSLEYIEREELMKEIRFLSQQTSKIGNNINQISHGINIIKKKKNKFLTKEDKINLQNYYQKLEIMCERYTLVTKKITNLKIS